ncbi:MAG: DNA polymerase III subunit epsilon [Gammaproteobacteria bacterium]|nr:DNA polymerase III subunit epsilon [Gammaproteobacteria bacterium]
MRQVVLDTETTGLDPKDGHRIIEIGCVELVGRRLTGNDFHQYLQPDREVEQGAIDVHGITNEFLADKPRFADVVDDFLKYIDGAELVIHNAPFDVGFMDAEFGRIDGKPMTRDVCTVLDTLVMARKMHPGQRASLDALCKRYDIDNSQRDYHGALLDAQILAEVYLAMTGGQAALSLDQQGGREQGASRSDRQRIDRDGLVLATPDPTAEELAAHQRLLESLREGGTSCVWDKYADE